MHFSLYEMQRMYFKKSNWPFIANETQVYIFFKTVSCEHDKQTCYAIHSMHYMNNFAFKLLCILRSFTRDNHCIIFFKIKTLMATNAWATKHLHLSHNKRFFVLSAYFNLHPLHPYRYKSIIIAVVCCYGYFALSLFIGSSTDFPSDSVYVQLLGLTDESEDIVMLIASFHVLSTCQHGGQLAEQVSGFGCRITFWTDATALQAHALDAPGMAAALNF
ncbi:conserved hypothetical protein [Trichinella spiralis]|uniref:hypothetical protein n=1 Tax=Trichinella spiralis TaxID=6334 RepID=UPI0001EFEEFE|nr:conserved hypothetical protein [Trichinella spiralis]